MPGWIFADQFFSVKISASDFLALFNSEYAIYRILILILILFAFFWIIKTFLREKYPYRPRPLLTKREYTFYIMLRREADRRGLLICPKVGLKDLMEVTTQKHYMKYFHKIAQKHVDFVICDDSLNVLFAVELDDSSHDSEDAKQRDKFKDHAFKAAHIPLKRIRDFDENSIRKLF
jgi:hypothetical protein